MRRREYEELPGVKSEKKRSAKFRRLVVLEILAFVLIALIPIPLIKYKQNKLAQTTIHRPNIEVSAENEQSVTVTPTSRP